MTQISKYIRKNFWVSISKTTTVSLETLILLPLIINRIGLDLFGIVRLNLLNGVAANIHISTIGLLIVLLDFTNEIIISLEFLGVLILFHQFLLRNKRFQKSFISKRLVPIAEPISSSIIITYKSVLA